MWELNGDVVWNTTPASFKSLMVTLIAVIPPGMWYCFWFTVLLGRAVLLVSTWPFPLFFQPYFTDQGTSGGIQPTIQCYSSSAFENQGNMHRTVSGTHRAQTPLISDLHDLLLWLVGHSDVLSILEITSVHPTSNSPWKFWLYPLSQYMVIWVKVIGPLGMIGWKVSNIQFWKYTGVLPQGDPAFPSFKWFWVCKLAQT